MHLYWWWRVISQHQQILYNSTGTYEYNAHKKNHWHADDLGSWFVIVIVRCSFKTNFANQFLDFVNIILFRFLTIRAFFVVPSNVPIAARRSKRKKKKQKIHIKIYYRKIAQRKKKKKQLGAHYQWRSMPLTMHPILLCL